MRHPHGPIGRLFYLLGAPLRWAAALFRILIVAPYYDVVEALHNFRGWLFSGSGVRGWGGLLLYFVLWLPRTLLWLIAEFFRKFWWGLTAWPKFVRLRDLAAGLPALIVTVLAIVALAWPTDGNELSSSYQDEMLTSHREASVETDPIVREQKVDRALFFARSLSLLHPEDKAFPYNQAILYAAKGDVARSQAIMSELAPRNTTGYGPAHLAYARQLTSQRLMSIEDFRSAVAHFDAALRSAQVDRDEVHRELGNLYYQAYTKLEATGANFLGLSRQKLLDNAEYHLRQYQGDDTQAKLLLGHILARRGNTEQARMSVQALIGDLQVKLNSAPFDVDLRLRLARAHASVMQLQQASDVLQEGKIRNPDPRYDIELSNIYFAQALEFQRTMPSAKQMPYQALGAALEMNPGNGLVVVRLLQSLIEKDKPTEAEFARKALNALPAELQRHSVVQFLLGYDAERRSLPQIAEKHFAAARGADDSLAPAVFADIANAVIERKFSDLSPAAGTQVYETAMRIWPTHPDLLYLRAKMNFLARRYAEALSDLNKAVAAKKNNATLALRLADDVRLNSLLASVYLGSGQRENAQRAQEAANAAQALRQSLK